MNYTLTTDIDSFVGDGSDDTFTTDAASLNVNDSLIGNGGNNSLVFSSAGNYDWTGVTLNVQNIIGSSGIDRLQKSGNQNVSAYTLTGIEVLEGLSVGSTFTINATHLVSGGGSVYSIIGLASGPSSINTLRTTDNNLNLAGTTLHNIQKLSTSNSLGTHFATFTGSNVNNAAMVIEGQNGDDTIHIVTEQMPFISSIGGFGGNNTLVLDASGTYDLNLLSSFTKVQNITGSTGDDTLLVKYDMITGAGTIDLGTGSNLLTLSSGTVLDLGAKTLIGVPTISSTVAGTTFTVAANQLLSNGGPLTAINGTGAGNLVTTSGTSLDMSGTALTNIGQLFSTSTIGTSFKIGTTGLTPLILTGGSGNDTFHVAAEQMPAAPGITVNGGTGINNVTLDTAGLYDLTTLAGFTNVQTVTGTTGNDGLIVNSAMLNTFTSIDLGTGNNALITIGAAFDLSAKTLTNVQTLVGPTSGATFTLGAGQANGNGGSIARIIGTGIGNTVSTSSTALNLIDVTLTNIQHIATTSTVGTTLVDSSDTHTILGGTGNDIITGSGGADTITGGGGADMFKDTAANLVGVSITDFGMDDSLDVIGLALPGASVVLTGNTLNVLSGGTQVAQITLTGTFVNHFSLTSDGSGGTLIKSTPIPVDPAPTPTHVVTFNGDDSGKGQAGTSGNDRFIGSTATDTVLQTGAKWSQSTVTANSDGSYTVAGANGTDQLSGIERIRFDDGVLLFNLPPSAKTLGGLYKAIFNRLGDENGLNFYVKTLAGLSSDSSLKTISNAFLQSQEAASLNQMSDAQFVTLMYQNALGRAPDAAGFQHHLNTLAHGNSRADVALEFSSSTEQLTLLGQFTNAGIFSPVADPLLG